MLTVGIGLDYSAATRERRIRPDNRGTQQNSRFCRRRVGTSCGKQERHESKGSGFWNGQDFSRRAGFLKSFSKYRGFDVWKRRWKPAISICQKHREKQGLKTLRGTQLRVLRSRWWLAGTACPPCARFVARAGDELFGSSPRVKTGGGGRRVGCWLRLPPLIELASLVADLLGCWTAMGLA